TCCITAVAVKIFEIEARSKIVSVRASIHSASGSSVVLSCQRSAYPSACSKAIPPWEATSRLALAKRGGSFSRPARTMPGRRSSSAGSRPTEVGLASRSVRPLPVRSQGWRRLPFPPQWGAVRASFTEGRSLCGAGSPIAWAAVGRPTAPAAASAVAASPVRRVICGFMQLLGRAPAPPRRGAPQSSLTITRREWQASYSARLADPAQQEHDPDDDERDPDPVRDDADHVEDRAGRLSAVGVPGDVRGDEGGD